VNPLVLNNPALLENLRSVNALRNEGKGRAQGTPVIGPEEVLHLILKRWEAKGRRRIVAGISGFPASGKTTFAKSISHSINDLCHSNLAIHLPMDGFHLSNEKLLAEGLESIKGDLATFDVTSYVKTILSYTQHTDSPLFAPDYVREKHDVAEDAIEIKPEIRILITEGIYVGYPAAGWEKLKPLLDVLFYLDLNPEQCADRIVVRSLAAGRSRERIIQQVKKDFRFMKTCVQILPNADYIVNGEALSV
jgi:pantothenate kinase